MLELIGIFVICKLVENAANLEGDFSRQRTGICFAICLACVFLIPLPFIRLVIAGVASCLAFVLMPRK